MRIIYTTQNQKQAATFSEFLKSKGIDNQCEVLTNNDWGNENYGSVVCHIWIIEEDALEEALKWKTAFENNPTSPEFQTNDLLKNILQPLDNAIKDQSIQMTTFGLKKEEPKMGFITLYILIACILLFLFSGTSTPEKWPASLPSTPVITAPVNKLLMYDYPKAFDEVDSLISTYGLDKVENPDLLPREGQIKVVRISKTAYWQGFYDKIVAYFQNSSNRIQIDTPLFEKIKEGEIWRFFTPVLLHGSFLHLLFNMLLFVILSKQMELKLGPLKLLLFILLTAFFSNTVQYLMSGTNFLGISGVICAMIGFVFTRQQKAPWEGYHFTSISLSSVFIFIGLMFALQFISFLVEIAFKTSISPGIANAAHLSGLFIGIVLGRLNFFQIKN